MKINDALKGSRGGTVRRKQKALNKVKKQRRAVLDFIEDAHQRHEHYLATNEGRLDSDEYRKAVHLMYEYFGDDDRMERMKMSYQITALAA